MDNASAPLTARIPPGCIYVDSTSVYEKYFSIRRRRCFRMCCITKSIPVQSDRMGRLALQPCPNYNFISLIAPMRPGKQLSSRQLSLAIILLLLQPQPYATARHVIVGLLTPAD
jgi:hypothetical protein